MSNKVIIQADAVMCEMIAPALARGGMDELCALEVDENVVGLTVRYGDARKVFSVPVRAGAVMDYIAYAVQSGADQAPVREIRFDGGAALDVIGSVFSRAGAQDVVLTEKETGLLCFLYESEARTASRDEILNAVWGYAQGVETHTLETHIYRLRQKIETDPAAPQILITKESGYGLNCAE